MHDRIAGIISIYNMFRPGRRAGVAVSGGADSVALLHILCDLAPELDVKLRVLHVNHCLRGEESDMDERFVADLAAQLGLPISAHRVDISGLARQTHDNLEQAARKVRYEYFHSLVSAGKVDCVAVGHTRSDQAETVLFRFLRGSGTAGLAGIRPVTEEGIVRPLLDVTRAEIEEYLGSRSIPWRHDSSNHDRRFARNRIRHELMPELISEWNPALEETLARMADVALGEEEYWLRITKRLAEKYLSVENGAVVMRRDEVAVLHPSELRRLLRYTVSHAKGNLRGINFRHVEQLAELVRSNAGDGHRQIPGIHATRSLDWVRISRAGLSGQSEAYHIPAPFPGMVMVPGGGTAVYIGQFSDPVGYPKEEVEKSYLVDPHRLNGPLALRSWKPGDRFRPSGYERPVKLKELFQKARIPSWDRIGWPIIVDKGSIVWTRRFGVAQDYAPKQGCRKLLRITEMDHRQRQ